jgi:hypothetical protein
VDQHGSKRRDRHTILIRAEWPLGPRTPAWDALWQRILTDLDREWALDRQACAGEPSSFPADETAVDTSGPREGGAP